MSSVHLHANDGSLTCSVFDREGKYLRTILPHPANLADEKLKGLKRLPLEDGSKVPYLHQAETRSLLPGVCRRNGRSSPATAGWPLSAYTKARGATPSRGATS